MGLLQTRAFPDRRQRIIFFIACWTSIVYSNEKSEHLEQGLEFFSFLSRYIEFEYAAGWGLLIIRFRFVEPLGSGGGFYSVGEAALRHLMEFLFLAVTFLDNGRLSLVHQCDGATVDRCLQHLLRILLAWLNIDGAFWKILSPSYIIST